MLPFGSATFFPFTSYRPSFYSNARYGYRSGRSSSNNLIPVQSPILGIRVLVPRELYNLFGGRSPSSLPPPPPPYDRVPNFQRPYNQPPYYPQAPNFPPQIPPNQYQPPGAGYPPINPATFFNLMRAFYPDLIHRPDPRYPNVFAIRLPTDPRPPTQLPDDAEALPPPPPPDFYRDPFSLAQQPQTPPPPPLPPLPSLPLSQSNQASSNTELPSDENHFLQPPLPQRNFQSTQQYSNRLSQQYNQQPRNRSPQLIIIRT